MASMEHEPVIGVWGRAPRVLHGISTISWKA